MSEQNTSGKRYSFYSLFKENPFEIEIPTIQRDYAQGRKGANEVRESFLNALFVYLDENVPNRDLDFVYGSTEKASDGYKFIPLDGQQRLTTLFLLHWFLAVKSDCLHEFRDIFLRNNKSRFTYLTRSSSADFIDALIQSEYTSVQITLDSDDDKTKLSEIIINEGWFYLSWTQDPTIQSMLVMLDAIQLKFGDRPDFYSRLTSATSPVITFLYLDLVEFNLSEDLYIKMNSRGKPLTPFENFKAKFEKEIGDLFVNSAVTFEKGGKKYGHKAYFSQQIDTDWADLFWNYKHLVGKPYTSDEEMMNFIRVIITAQYLSSDSPDLEVVKELARTQFSEENDSEIKTFYRYEQLGVFTTDFVNYLILALDSLKNGTDKCRQYLQDTFYYNEADVFTDALKQSLTQPRRIIYHAYLKALIDNKDGGASLDSWMRVVHNLVENTRIEEPEHLIAGFKSVNHLLPESDSILKYLSGQSLFVSFFSSWQVTEERLKAHLIHKSKKWESYILETERKHFHKGQIAYLFEFAGIWKYFSENQNCDWSDSEDVQYYNSMVEYTEKSVTLFSFAESLLNENYIFERALLTKGNYLIPASKNRLNFCSSNTTVKNYVRDFSWKRLMRFSADDEQIWENKRSFVKQLFDDSRIDLNDLVNSLNTIITDGAQDWRNYFITDPRLITYCYQGFIAVKNDEQGNEIIELYRESQQNHYHIDMFLYDWYLRHIESNLPAFMPFTTPQLGEIKSSHDHSSLILKGWFIKDCEYELRMTKMNGVFAISFKAHVEVMNESEYDDQICSALTKHGLTWNSESFSFVKEGVPEGNLLNEISIVCNELNKL